MEEIKVGDYVSYVSPDDGNKTLWEYGAWNSVAQVRDIQGIYALLHWLDLPVYEQGVYFYQINSLVKLPTPSEELLAICALAGRPLTREDLIKEEEE